MPSVAERILSTTVSVGLNTSRHRMSSTAASIPLSVPNAASIDERPRRSFMYVPGSSEKMLDKAVSGALGADTLVFDLEDGVAPNQKEQVWFSYRVRLLNIILICSWNRPGITSSGR